MQPAKVQILYTDSASRSSALPDTVEKVPMPPTEARNRGHVVVHAGSIVLAVITQVIVGFFFILAEDSFVTNALFQVSAGNGSETSPLEVTMDWWSQYFWIMIDLWSMAWLIYAVVGLFKRNVLGPESCNPEIHPPVFYHAWTLINIARMCGVIINVLGAVLSWWLSPVLSFYMLYISYNNLIKHKAALNIISPGVITWTRYLTQNGLAAFAWWSLLNATVYLGIVLKYQAGMPDPMASTIVLTIVCFSILIWFFLQRFLLNIYLRSTYSIYAILILGLGSMFTRSYHVSDITANTVYCGFLMVLVTILSSVHLISECLREDESSKPVALEPYVTFECRETAFKPAGPQK